MSRLIFGTTKIRRTIPLLIALALTFGYVAVAHAQIPEEAQYGSPTATAAGNPATSGKAAGSGASAKQNKAESSKAPVSAEPKSDAGTKGGPASQGSAEAKGKGGSSAKVLPATGGQSIALAALGTLALSALGLLVLQRVVRR